MTLARQAGHEPMPIPRVPRTRAMGTFPFDAAGRGRRGIGWNPPFLGLNTLLFSHGLRASRSLPQPVPPELQARNRDAVRNSAWAAGAVDSYVANAIGRGIRLVPHHPDEKVRDLITRKWNRWTRECDVEYDPAESCIWPDGFLRPADGDRARRHGGG